MILPSFGCTCSKQQRISLRVPVICSSNTGFQQEDHTSRTLLTSPLRIMLIPLAPAASRPFIKAPSHFTFLAEQTASLMKSGGVSNMFNAVHMHDMAGSNSMQAGLNSTSTESLSHAADLQQLGFTSKQAGRVLAYMSSQNRAFDFGNTRQWLQLLSSHFVEQPQLAVSQHPIILTSKAENVKHRAEQASQWACSLGLTREAIVHIITKRPMFLSIPRATAEGVAAWLIRELGWDADMICKTLVSSPWLFGLNPVKALAPKLAWFISQGFSVEIISKGMFHTPSIMNVTIAHHGAQLSALHAMGLTMHQVTQLIQSRPSLLTRNMSGSIIQSKVRFLTQVMGKQIGEVVTCSTYLTYSLSDRTGPRCSFHSLYCPGQPFVLNTRLTVADDEFVRVLVSPSLDAASALSGLTSLQLYADFKAQWPQREGKEWDMGNANV